MIPIAIVSMFVGFAAGSAIGHSNTEYEQEDHDKLALTIGFLIATNQLQSPEEVYYFIYQVLTSAKRGDTYV